MESVTRRVICWCLTLSTIATAILATPDSWRDRMSDYKNHYCIRDCSTGDIPKVCEYEFTIEHYYTLTKACYDCPYNVTDCFRPHCVAADGVPRGILSVNRMLPGPAIQVCEGDTIVVKVKNMMEGGEGVTIHWHGVLQQGTPHMDGVSMVTQCPIPAHSTFQYKFLASSTGTHFWHAHSGLQRADGIFGALVIRQHRDRDPHFDLYDVDSPDHVIIVNDWLEDMGATRFAGHHHAMGDNQPRSVLINGRGALHQFSQAMSSSHYHMMAGMNPAPQDTADHKDMPANDHMMSFGDDKMVHNPDQVDTVPDDSHVMSPPPEMDSDGGMMGHPTKATTTNTPMSHDGHMMNMATEKPDSSMQNMTHGENTMTHMSIIHATDAQICSCNMTQSDHAPNTTSGDSVFTPHAIFHVKVGFRYRFRIASNGILHCPLQISVDNHTLLVIATDGAPFKPIVVQSFNIFAGERWDFILSANQPIGNYWIRARGLADCGAEFKMASETAILRYEGSPDVHPSAATDYMSGHRGGKILNPLNEKSTEDNMCVADLEALTPLDETLRGEPDKRFYMALDFNMISNPRFLDPELYSMADMMLRGHHGHHLMTPQINHITHVTPHAPPLTQLNEIPEDMFCNEDELERDCTRELCKCTHLVKVALGDVVELVLVDEGKNVDNNHPMHLHGFKFRVLAMDKLNTSTTREYVKQLDREGKIHRKLDNAVLKDSVTVPDGGYTIIRFKADNPGFWLFHCHMAFHMMMGMSMVFQVGEPHEMTRTPLGFPRCGNWMGESTHGKYVCAPMVQGQSMNLPSATVILTLALLASLTLRRVL